MERAERAIKEWRTAKIKEYELLGAIRMLKAAVLFFLLFAIAMTLGFMTIAL